MNRPTEELIEKLESEKQRLKQNFEDFIFTVIYVIMRKLNIITNIMK